MSGSIEMDKCDFCQEIKQVERTYLKPSKYVKEQGAFINKTLYNEGDYFIIVKTCSECGTPTSSQTEISDEEIENELVDLLYDFEYEEIKNSALYKFDYEGCAKALTKWYREQLKKK